MSQKNILKLPNIGTTSCNQLWSRSWLVGELGQAANLNQDFCNLKDVGDKDGRTFGREEATLS